MKLDSSELMVVSRLFARNSWKEIKDALEDHFKDSDSINPFMQARFH